MVVNVNDYSDKHNFVINGASYIGAPRSNTAMFVSRKIGNIIEELKNVDECLVFAEEGLNVSDELLQKHCFVFSDNPQREYAEFSKRFYYEEEKNNEKIGYDLSPKGFFISKTASVLDDALIEPGVIIGPGVVIGKNARIYSGAVIKNCRIGNNVIINEGAVIGANGFTMANDINGNKTRIFSLGKVIIGDNVEIGVHDNISRGSGGDTIIEDFVKIDALVHVGHDVHLGRNVEITAGSIIGGFVEAKEGAYVGINAVVRNRLILGRNSFVGMGATVTKSVGDNTTVIGNPAKPYIK